MAIGIGVGVGIWLAGTNLSTVAPLVLAQAAEFGHLNSANEAGFKPVDASDNVVDVSQITLNSGSPGTWVFGVLNGAIVATTVHATAVPAGYIVDAELTDGRTVEVTIYSTLNCEIVATLTEADTAVDALEAAAVGVTASDLIEDDPIVAIRHGSSGAYGSTNSVFGIVTNSTLITKDKARGGIPSFSFDGGSVTVRSAGADNSASLEWHTILGEVSIANGSKGVRLSGLEMRERFTDTIGEKHLPESTNTYHSGGSEEFDSVTKGNPTVVNFNNYSSVEQDVRVDAGHKFEFSGLTGDWAALNGNGYEIVAKTVAAGLGSNLTSVSLDVDTSALSDFSGQANGVPSISGHSQNPAPNQSTTWTIDLGTDTVAMIDHCVLGQGHTGLAPGWWADGINLQHNRYCAFFSNNVTGVRFFAKEPISSGGLWFDDVIFGAFDADLFAMRTSDRSFGIDNSRNGVEYPSLGTISAVAVDGSTGYVTITLGSGDRPSDVIPKSAINIAGATNPADMNTADQATPPLWYVDNFVNNGSNWSARLYERGSTATPVYAGMTVAPANGAGTFTINATRAADFDRGRGFVDGTKFKFGGTPPAEFDTSTNYFVRDSSGGVFKIALTDGGTALTFTDDGTNPTIIPQDAVYYAADGANWTLPLSGSPIAYHVFHHFSMESCLALIFRNQTTVQRHLDYIQISQVLNRVPIWQELFDCYVISPYTDGLDARPLQIRLGGDGVANLITYVRQTHRACGFHSGNTHGLGNAPIHRAEDQRFNFIWRGDGKDCSLGALWESGDYYAESDPGVTSLVDLDYSIIGDVDTTYYTPTGNYLLLKQNDTGDDYDDLLLGDCTLTTSTYEPGVSVHLIDGEAAIAQSVGSERPAYGALLTRQYMRGLAALLAPLETYAKTPAGAYAGNPERLGPTRDPLSGNYVHLKYTPSAAGDSTDLVENKPTLTVGGASTQAMCGLHVFSLDNHDVNGSYDIFNTTNGSSDPRIWIETRPNPNQDKVRLTLFSGLFVQSDALVANKATHVSGDFALVWGATGDGASDLTLKMAIYDLSDGSLVSSGTDTVTAGSGAFDMSLITGWYINGASAGITGGHWAHIVDLTHSVDPTDAAVIASIIDTDEYLNLLPPARFIAENGLTPEIVMVGPSLDSGENFGTGDNFTLSGTLTPVAYAA